MKTRLKGIFLAAAVLTVLTGSLAACDGDEDDDNKFGLTAVMVIMHLDTDKDGVPDIYQYVIQLSGDADSKAFDRDLSVRTPGGSVLATTCAAVGNDVACRTPVQTATTPGNKTTIPAGTYAAVNDYHTLMEFGVSALDLDPARDPAPADPASLDPTPAAAGTLGDPAVLDWDTTTPNPAGNRWDYTVVNTDGDDDNGGVAGASSPDYPTSNFTLDLPDAWDNADALEIEISAVAVLPRSNYTLVLVNQSIVTGYTLAK